MYYILNGSNQIVAVDNSLLNLCETADISELTLKTALNEINFVLTSDTELTITHLNSQRKFPISKTYFSSLLGALTMIQIGNEIGNATAISRPIRQKTIQTSPVPTVKRVEAFKPIKEEDSISALLLDDSEEEEDIENEIEDIGIEFLHALEQDKTPVLNLTPDSLQTDKIHKESKETSDYSALFNLQEKEEAQEVPQIDTVEEKIEKDENTPEANENYAELFNLPESETLSQEEEEEEEEIPIDVSILSEAIGISDEDYDVFLDEYIDTALNLEEDLRGETKSKKEEAIATLSHLSDVLHLPILHEKITKITESSTSTEAKTIDSFYSALSRISPFYTEKENKVVEIPAPTPQVEEEESFEFELELELDEPNEIPTPAPAPQVEKEESFEFELELDEPNEIPAPAPSIPEPAKSSNDDLFELDLDMDMPLVETPAPSVPEPAKSNNDDLFELDLDMGTASDTVEKIETIESTENIFEIVEPIIEPVIEEPVSILASVEKTKIENANSFGTLDLEGIKPIHFDFQVEEAANDLSLPVELIEEFVNDFIDQAREETIKMITAYEKGDLDSIQKIGHLLKGTSSNLRIKPLADTLYQIQFCEDSSRLDYLIKDYWGHFLSFEIQIKAITH